MPIDDPTEVAELLDALKAAMPLKMLLGPGLRLTLKRQGLEIPVDTPVVVQRIFYAGDEGGIVCGLRSQSGENAVVVSITHLAPMPDHALAGKITEYQRRRVAGIAKQNARGAGSRGGRKAKLRRR